MLLDRLFQLNTKILKLSLTFLSKFEINLFQDIAFFPFFFLSLDDF